MFPAQGEKVMNEEDIRNRINKTVNSVRSEEEREVLDKKLEVLRGEQLEGCYPLLVDELCTEFSFAVRALNETMQQARGAQWQPVALMDARPSYIKATQAAPQAVVVVWFHERAKRLVVEHEYERHGGTDKDQRTYIVDVRDARCIITTDSGSVTNRVTFISDVVDPFVKSVAEGEKALAHRKY
jgi:hypothetical protein